jgi:hypothetical protein
MANVPEKGWVDVWGLRSDYSGHVGFCILEGFTLAEGVGEG